MECLVKILNESGVHARPASVFVKTACQFSSDIAIKVNNKNVNGKSIMNLLSLGLKKNDEIMITAKGSDEKEAIEALVHLVDSKFGE
ncbi:HPr family phosphocarrier protein [Anaeromicrobium sediminis]|uniref:Phosphocarrier protein HPr n=1 Tax=Anaeromicrobium sediminis TaxID=1478221 RepID=A0A267MN24_9FIRM|nr:HPr family phosphocarrier protein [Anaeromicrobium sediminis]PAB60223.1 phosphocarrier protein HPr [Anaeromicrobium sediminis]